MKVQQFCSDSVKRVRDFTNAWKKAHTAAPESFPNDLTLAEWREEFAVWDGKPFDTEFLP